MLRILGILAVVAVLGSAMFASAATLSVDGGVIQAGNDSTLYCTTSARIANWALERDDNTIRFITVQLDPVCKGDYTMFVRLEDGLDNVLFDGVKTTLDRDDGKYRFDFAAPYLTPDDIEEVKIWVHSN